MPQTSSEPLVTVYIPTHNRLELLKRAIQSVLTQDHKNIELIVVDDNSSDYTYSYLETLAIHDPRIKPYRNSSNLGACASRNKAILNAKGAFITGLDDDDYFLSGRISSFLNSWSKRKQNSLALFSESEAILKGGKIVKTKRPKYVKNTDLIDSNFVGNQIFTRTEYLKQIGGFDENFPAWQDLECWYRLTTNLHGHLEKSEHITYRVDMSHEHERISSKKISHINIAHNLFCKKFNLTSREREILSLQIGTYKPIEIPGKIILKKIMRNPSFKVYKQTTRLLLQKFGLF